MYKLVLLRHGESEWNRDNRFTGWTDIDLSEKGVEEAKKSAQLLKDAGLVFDVAFTSMLKRSIRTLWIVLDEMDLMWIPVYNSWRLNERHYGALQGLNKSEMTIKFGEDQVQAWRRSYDVRPPALASPQADPRYEFVPLAESLKDTIERVMPYWEEEIVPAIKSGKRVFISASGNSMRAIVKYLDKMPPDEIVKFNVPTGFPLVYELDENLNPIRRYFLGNPEEIKAATEKVAGQHKARN